MNWDFFFGFCFGGCVVPVVLRLLDAWNKTYFEVEFGTAERTEQHKPEDTP